MEEENKQQETKEMLVRVNLRFDSISDIKSTYILVSGIPKDLPVEYEETVLKAAERQFAQALNAQKFLEVYPENTVLQGSVKPCFMNLELIKNIEIISISKVC